MKPRQTMQDIQRRRAAAMIRAVRSSEMSDEELMKFFMLCLHAHEIDTLKESCG